MSNLVAPMLALKKYTLVPEEYQHVEYIEATGTQHIDTGLEVSYNNKFVVDFAITQQNVYSQIGGFYSSVPDTDFCLYVSNENLLSYSLNQGYTTTNFTPAINRFYNVDFSKDGIIVDGNRIADVVSGAYSASAQKFYLFWAGIDGKNLKGKIKRAKIYDNGVLLRDYVPCYRKSDNVVGLYDRVNDVFYANNGTGTFIKGDDILNKRLFSPLLSIKGGS